MEKISLLLLGGLLACVFAVILRDDEAYDVAYASLHKKVQEMDD
jgi:hypothetical protein